MNNVRRKKIEKIISQLEEIKSGVDYVLEEEQDSYDALPEGIRDSDRGEEMEEFIDDLENASESIGDSMDYLGNVL